MAVTKSKIPTEKNAQELEVMKIFLGMKEDTKNDLTLRVNGVPSQRGSTGYQFSGYKTLQQFYRGDQWDHAPQPGQSQRTDNYCAVIVDNLASLIFDDAPEISCPVDDMTDEVLGLQAEAKERLIWRVWEDNDYQVVFDEWSKQASAYGDGFLKGPWIEKVDSKGRLIRPDDEGSWRIRFDKIENPASIRVRFEDSSNRKILDFVHSDRISVSKAMRLYGDLAQSRGLTITGSLIADAWTTMLDDNSKIPKVNIDEYWNDEVMGLFINDSLLDFYAHNWGFVPLQYMKNNYVPNYPYGKSDLEDVLDPQVSHNETNNDLANLLKWISSINMWGKNLEGMQALVAGLSRIYSLPEDGELHTFEKTGDPYITNTFVQGRRSAIIDISGVSESMLSSSQVSNASGRALALAFQGTIRKLNPRAKRYAICLKNLNANILKLYEIYFPKTKSIINGDYRNKVHLPTTLLRNIVDTINKFQSGLISHETAMREAGVAQPKQERKLMIHDLSDPLLGPQVARQPSLLPRLSEGQNAPGDQPMPAPGNSPAASQAGAVAANNNHAGGAGFTPPTE